MRTRTAPCWPPLNAPWTLEPKGLWSVNRLNYFLGTPVRHGGWSPDRHLRLFPKGAAIFNARLVHEGMEATQAGAVVRPLDGRLHHHSYPDLSGYLQRMNRYTSLQAEELLQGKGARPSLALARMLADPPLTFLKMYVLRRGFMDGGLGLNLALLSASSTFWKYAKWWHRSWMARAANRARLALAKRTPGSSREPRARAAPHPLRGAQLGGGQPVFPAGGDALKRRFAGVERTCSPGRP